MAQARDRIRSITQRKRLQVPVDQVVQEVARYLHAWAGYFRYGNSTHFFDKIRSFALVRIALFVAKRHGRKRSYGWRWSTRRPRG